MDTSDEETYEASNNEEEPDDDDEERDGEEDDVDDDEIYEDDDDSMNLSSNSRMSLDHEEVASEVTPCWPPQSVANLSNINAASNNRKKPGIVYLSTIPPGYNVSTSISFFSQFGKVGRVFLQPDVKEKSKRKDKLARNFTEGWIEFLSKRVAKDVASELNNQPVGGKKRSKSHDVLWNIKYLPKFKWTHLSERLAYEKAVHHQRLRTEISQAKREADFFKSNVEKSKRMARKRPRSDSGEDQHKKRPYEFRQKETDSSIRKRNQRKRDSVT